MILCVLCGEAAREYLQLPHTRVWRCRNSVCELQFAYPQIDDTQLRDAYRQLYYPDNGSGSGCLEPTPASLLRQFFENTLSRRGPLKGKRLLDYGCGSAVLSEVAHGYGMAPTGIEADLNARNQIRAARICPVYADLPELLAAEPGAQFDWIVLWNVIEHLRQPWADLSELLSMLAPRGRIVVTTANAESLRARLSGARWTERLNATHFYYFTRKSLTATLSKAGFVDIQNEEQYTAYPHHGPARQLLQRALVALGLAGELEFSAAAGMRSMGRF